MCPTEAVSEKRERSRGTNVAASLKSAEQPITPPGGEIEHPAIHGICYIYVVVFNKLFDRAHK